MVKKEKVEKITQTEQQPAKTSKKSSYSKKKKS